MNGLPDSGQASWYVVYTKPRQEFRALEHLENQHFVCFFPTLRQEKNRRGRLETCEEALFSRYLFIRLDQVSSNWSAIRNTRGVIGLVAFGNRYATLPDSWIDEMKSSSSLIERALFMPGECISIASGPLAGLEGILQIAGGDARAIVLLELMSQPQKLRISLEALRKVA